MEIIVDDRERAVVPFLEDISAKYNINYSIQRNEVGDYAIVYKGYILLIIERKTWVDLSASMRDGRKENVQKLLAVREKTGCQLAYLIEGDATPKAGKKFGRLPIKNLRAHLDHLAFRDGIHMVYSKDEEYTAGRLFELAQNYMTLDMVIKEIDELENKDEIKGGEEKDNPNVAELTTKQNCSKGIEEQLLRCLPGIGSIVSTVLAENKITVPDLYNGKYTADDIAAFKYPTGASIGIVRGEKIVTGSKKTIDSKSKLGHKLCVKLLSTIPLISAPTAEKILAEVSLGDIMVGQISTDTLTNIQKTEKSKVGKKAAENILLYLANVSGMETTVEESPQNTEPPEPVIATVIRRSLVKKTT